MDGDYEGEGDNDAVNTLKDALQEALDNDQMGLVSKIAEAIAKLQGSSANSADILAGGEETDIGADAGGSGEGEGSVSVADILGDEGEAPAEGLEAPAGADDAEGAEEETVETVTEEPSESASESGSESEDKSESKDDEKKSDDKGPRICHIQQGDEDGHPSDTFYQACTR